MARLIAMSPQHVGARVFFDELTAALFHWKGQHQLVELKAWLELKYRVFAGTGRAGSCSQRRRRHGDSRQSALKSISDDVVVLRPLFSDQRFRCGFQHRPIAGRTGAYKRDEEIASGHIGRVSEGSGLKLAATRIVTQIVEKVFPRLPIAGSRAGLYMKLWPSH